MQNLFFDSMKYSRHINIRAIVTDTSKRIYFQNEFKCSLFKIWDIGFAKRLDIIPVDSYEDSILMTCFNALFEQRNKCNPFSPFAILSFKPLEEDGNSLDMSVYIDDSISYFDDNETKNRHKMYTMIIDNSIFAQYNGEKIDFNEYEKYLNTSQILDEEEKNFIEKSISDMLLPTWFPTQKEFLETKKKLDKEKKQKEKENKSLFQKKQKKKETEKSPIQTGEGEFVNPKSLKIHKGSLNPDYELENIIGLENIKTDIKKMQYMLEYEKSRETRGISTHDVNSLHMCFLGHPGTGKTMIARIMTGILYDMKYIKENKCIEISGLDLQGGYVGQSAIITKHIVDMAKGGILFVDEAYALCNSSGFGKEAISVLLKEMEDNRNDLIVIFAGYEDDMNRFLNMNQGFRSRVNKYFDFVDYNTIELGMIFLQFLKKAHLKISKEALIKCMQIFKEQRQKPNFSNGRFVRNLYEQIEEQHILNVVNDMDNERMDTIISEDIPQNLIIF